MIYELPLPVQRTCCRCGRAFETRRREVTCEPCRHVASRRLTGREIQIADLVAEGRPNKEIAYELHLTEGTVKQYLCAIFAKAGCSNRTQLALLVAGAAAPAA